MGNLGKPHSIAMSQNMDRWAKEIVIIKKCPKLLRIYRIKYLIYSFIYSFIYLYFFIYIIIYFSQVSLYLFKELPIHLWRPLESDVATLREWILQRDLTSPENLLARLVLEKMNWGFNKQVRKKSAKLVKKPYCY